jgi:Fe-S-cluster containining protein
MNREAVYRELEAVYAALADELAELRPLCQTSGRCCRFKESGHELWTTRLELDYLLDHGGPPAAPPRPEGVCPYLKHGLCSVRDHRMLGCRIYFCDPSYAAAMGPLYERYHRRIKEVHRNHGLPYEYAEFLRAWRDRQVPGS